MKILVLTLVWAFASAQQDRIDNAIQTIFNTNDSFGNFLPGFEEVTPPPLKSIGALPKCGEGELRNRMVCVPYYNCDPDTNTVIANPNLDGTNKIDIRAGENEPRCDHYLDICCRVANTSSGIQDQTTTTQPPTVVPTPTRRPTSSPPTQPTPSPPTRPTLPPTPRPQPRLVNCGIRNPQGIDFNFSGRNEAQFGEFPWMVAILRKNPVGRQTLAVCGGSLIGPRIVLTGAHCVQEIDVNSIKVRAGEWDTQTERERIPFQERNVARKIVHEHYTKGNLYNDVALLILERPFAKTASVGTACLPQQDQQIDSSECFATGWGKDTFGAEGKYSVILKKIQLPLVDHDSCQRALRTTRLGQSFILHRSFTCAGGEPGVDTCTGDGGSPLVCPDPDKPNRYLQVGIVAWGIGCGETQIPGVYVDVAQYRRWVDLRVQELGMSTDSYVL